MADLLPCPFCGAAPCEVPQNGWVEKADGNFEVSIWCENCGAHGGERQTAARAIDAWNRRAPDPRIADLEARLAAVTAESNLARKYLVETGRKLGDAEAALAKARSALEPFANIADLILAETDGLADEDAFDLHLHDYLIARFRTRQFRDAREVLALIPAPAASPAPVEREDRR